MNTIVVTGPPGSGINFLKNVFLLSERLQIALPSGNQVVDRFEFMVNYYLELQEKIKNNGDWLEHEWSLRLSHYCTDMLDREYKLVKVDLENPTVLSIHNENSILVDDPLSIVTIIVDDKPLCEKLYRVKSKSASTFFDYNSLNTDAHKSRNYYRIKFSDLLNDHKSIFDLSEMLDLHIDIDKIRILHELWAQSNKIILEI